MKKEPGIHQALLDEVHEARGADRRLDHFVRSLETDLPQADESSARRIAERLALSLEASLMIQHANASDADAFCASRLNEVGRMFGTLPATTKVEAVGRH